MLAAASEQKLSPLEAADQEERREENRQFHAARMDRHGTGTLHRLTGPPAAASLVGADWRPETIRREPGPGLIGGRG
jgi:hypothetical protein